MSIILEINRTGLVSEETDFDSYLSNYEDGCVVGLGFESVEVVENEKNKENMINSFFDYVEKKYTNIKNDSIFNFSLSIEFKNSLFQKLVEELKQKCLETNTLKDFNENKIKIETIINGDEQFFINYEDLCFFGTFEEFVLQFDDFEQCDFEISRVLFGF